MQSQKDHKTRESLVEKGNVEHRKHDRLKLALPVEAQINRSGFRSVQIVDISSTGLQLWSDSVEGFETEGIHEFEVKFKAKLAWTQPMEDRSFLTGWEIEPVSVDKTE